MSSSSARHPLLIYIRLIRAWRWPALVIAALCGLLWWLAPPALGATLVQAGLLAAGALALGLFAYTLAAPALCYVQCRPRYLLVSTPFFRLAISYSRLRTTRPTRFAPDDLRGRQRWLAQPFLGQTAVALDLLSYPLRARWLRLWLGPLMVPGTFRGLVCVVPDWMALSRDVDVFHARWKTRRQDQAQAEAFTSFSRRGRF